MDETCFKFIDDQTMTITKNLEDLKRTVMEQGKKQEEQLASINEQLASLIAMMQRKLSTSTTNETSIDDKIGVVENDALKSEARGNDDREIISPIASHKQFDGLPKPALTGSTAYNEDYGKPTDLVFPVFGKMVEQLGACKVFDELPMPTLKATTSHKSIDDDLDVNNSQEEATYNRDFGNPDAQYLDLGALSWLFEENEKTHQLDLEGKRVDDVGSVEATHHLVDGRSPQQISAELNKEMYAIQGKEFPLGFLIHAFDNGVYLLIDDGEISMFVFDPGGDSWFHIVWCSLKANVDKHDFGFGAGKHNAGSCRWKICPYVATMLEMVFGILMSRDVDTLLSKSSDPFHKNVGYDSGITDETTVVVAGVVDMDLGLESNRGFVEKFVAPNAVHPVLDKFPQPIFILTSGDVKNVEQYAYEYELARVNLHSDSTIFYVNKVIASVLTTENLAAVVMLYVKWLELAESFKWEHNDGPVLDDIVVQIGACKLLAEIIGPFLAYDLWGIQVPLHSYEGLNALSYEEVVFGVSFTNSPSMTKLEFDPKVFDPGIDIHLIKDLVNQLNANSAVPWAYLIYILEDKDDFKRGGNRMICKEEMMVWNDYEDIT